MQKAENGQNSIYVSIYEFEKSLFKKYDNLEKITIKDVMSATDYKNFIIESTKQADKVLGINDRQITEYFDTEINGNPAYGCKYTFTQYKEGEMIKYTEINYSLMLGNVMYSVIGKTPTENFNSLKSEIENSINSFKFIR